jgi:hypothetical protein
MPRNPLRLAVLAPEYRNVARLPGAAGTDPALAILGVFAGLGGAFGIRA